MNLDGVQLVLDASAAVEYTRGSIHVGEVLSLVADDNALALLPLPCLIEAAYWSADRSVLEALVNHPSVTVLAEDPGQWPMLSATCELVGRPEAATAALAALDARVGLLTKHPDLYARVDPGNMAISIDY